MKLLIALMIGSICSISSSFLWAEPLTTSEELYVLCYQTHYSMLKDEIILYNHTNGREVIRNLCSCTTPLILEGLNKKQNYFVTCINPKVNNDLFYDLDLRAQSCTELSENVMKQVLNQVRSQCDIGQKQLEPLLDDEKTCSGDYCEFIMKTT